MDIDARLTARAALLLRAGFAHIAQQDAPAVDIQMARPDAMPDPLPPAANDVERAHALWTARLDAAVQEQRGHPTAARTAYARIASM